MPLAMKPAKLAQPTRGPWKAHGGQKSVIRASNGDRIADVHWVNRLPNGRLVSAAPELLDLAQDLLHFGRLEASVDQIGLTQTIEKARQLIARVQEGGAA